MVNPVARGAAQVAVLTATSRLAGLGRQLVFQATVGATLLGTVYTTANALPNIVFEVVAGGALAGAVVPLLAAAASRGDAEQVRRTTGALIGWTLTLLIPVTVVAMLAVVPLARVLLGGVGGPQAEAMTARMLLVFLPQVPLYGLAVVTGAALNAHRRFNAAAVAPLVSSAVLIVVYLTFAAALSQALPDTSTDPRSNLAVLPRPAEYLLSVGTTLAVLALTLTTLLPAVRAGIVGRPSLRLPAGQAKRVRALAAAGVVMVGTQQLALLLVIRSANSAGGAGALVTWQYAFLLMMLPFAVLAYPIATAAFPELAAAGEEGRDDDFARASANALRGVVVAGGVGVAVLVATAAPVARFFGLLGQTPTSTDFPELATALVAIAPASLGTGALLLLTRALLARHRTRMAAFGTALGWGSAALLTLVAVTGAPAGEVVAAIGAAVSVGLLIGVVACVLGLRAAAGAAAVAGVGRAAAVAVVAAAAGGAAGAWAAGRLAAALGGATGTDVGTTLLVGVTAGVIALVVGATPALLVLRAANTRGGLSAGRFGGAPPPR
jgi:putative peptidoglycan lipid II flippase